MNVKPVVTALILAALLTQPLAASTEPTSSRGFAPDQVYHFTGIDAVNDFTGNLEVKIPIGPAFKTNGTLTYSFTLSYHSNLWDYEEYTGTVGRPTPYNWDHANPIDAFPIADFNAGLGWRLSVAGHPKRHPLSVVHHFVDQTGAEHAYNGFTTNKSVTNDSSYYRFTTSDGVVTAEYPDGTRERHICLTPPCTGGIGWYDLDQKSDAFGDILYVTRPATVPTVDGQTWVWTYHEAIANVPYPDWHTAALTPIRTHTVEYTVDSRMPSGFRITKVTLASPGTNHQAEYKFGYEEGSILRPFTQSVNGQATVPYGQPDNNMRLALLKSITLPDPAAGDSNGNWLFSYIIVPSNADYPGDVQPRSSANGQIHWQASHYSGLLETITLPTKGAIHYKYEQRILFKEWCGNGDGGIGIGQEARHQSFVSIGVRERAVLLPNGNADGRPWRYFGATFQPNCGQREFIGATLDPQGVMNVSYFSVYTDAADNPGGIWSKYDWGQPISKEEQDSSGRYIQSRVFQCTNLSPFDNSDLTVGYGALRRLHQRYLTTGEQLSCGSPVRSNYALQDNDGGYCRGDYNTDCDQSNRRVLATTNVFHDDGDSFNETINSDYDGLGHYRTVKTGGNFFAINPGHLGVVGGDERITFTGYNPGVVFTNHNYISFPDGKNLGTIDWILNTYDLKKIKQGRNGEANAASPQVSSMLYHFNPATGFLERERHLRRSVDCTWVQSTASANCFTNSFLDRGDVIIQNTRTQSGSSTSVKTEYFGGDFNAVLTAGDLSNPYDGDPEYVMRTDFRYGEIESRGYYDCGDSVVLITEQNVIDPNSGLVTSSSDDSGAVTTYQYDNQGRYKTVDPPGNDAATDYSYTAATASTPAIITAKVAAGALQTQSWEFDHLGRIAAEKRSVPTSATSVVTSAKHTTYLANGWKTSESTTGPDPGVASTTYTDFDPFGRPKTVLHPDHVENSHVRKTTFQYLGSRGTVETTWSVGLAPGHQNNGNTSVISRFNDRFGNLARVQEASGNQDNIVTTKYEYDVQDHLTLVNTAGQRRRFSYDMRGFMTSEDPPELAGRTIRYPLHDSRGNPRRKLYSRARAAALPLDTLLAYDRAERLVSVRQVSTGNLLKELKYFPHGSSTPLSSGRLQWSVRHNWTPPPATPTAAAVDTPVRHDFTYNNSSGRLSKRVTTAAGLIFTTQFTYDGLGSLASVTYPALTACNGCAPSRTVNFSYKEGRLISVPGYASSIVYAANDTVVQVAHTNGTNDFFDVNTANYMKRPTRVHTTFMSGAEFDGGAIDYDGAGNVTTIGAQSYAYDAVNRLTHINGSQAFSYDSFGNLMTMPGATLLTSAAGNNRLPSPAAAYDEGGNLVSWTDSRDGSTATRDYDAFNLITHNRGAGQGKIFYYDCNDERVAVFDYAGTPGKIQETWSLRGPVNEVLRDFTRLRTTSTNEIGPWSWRDNVFRGGTLLAEIRPAASGSGEDVLHVHVDHLGSIRRLSNNAGQSVDAQDFQPFGQETNEQPDLNRFKFTGHERDFGTTPFGEVDYMHARYYASTLGRFLSLDPAKGKPELPQTWNRYVYARNNPLGRVDPDGRSDFNVTSLADKLAEQWDTLKESVQGVFDAILDAAPLPGSAPPPPKDPGGGLGLFGGPPSARQFARNATTVAGNANVGIVQEVSVSGGYMTGGYTNVQGDQYTFLGPSTSTVPSVSYSVGVTWNYTGTGSYGGPFVNLTSPGPVGLTWSFNPEDMNAAQGLQLTFSTSPGFNGSYTVYNSIPSKP